MFRKIFANKHSRTWAIVTMSVIALFLIVTIVTSTVLFEVVCSFLGGKRNVIKGGGNVYFTSDFDTKREATAAGEKLTEEICEEGFVLLKNENNALPLATSSTAKAKISVFGKNSTNLVYGGTGSGAIASASINLYDSLNNANYDVNPTLKAFYESSASGSGRPANPNIEDKVPFGFATGETPVSSYTQDVKNSFASYKDMALVVISRIGGEGNDMPMTMRKSASNNTPVEGAASASDHYLELDQNEQDMLQMVCEAGFDRVVLIVNSNNAIELGFLVDPDAYLYDETLNHFDYASAIDAAIWVGGPGSTGIGALGKILNGSVNPSGRTVDTYASDFTKTTTYNNVSWGGVNRNDSYIQSGSTIDQYFVDYEEGIYVGYRYYETAAYEHDNGRYASFDYDKEVVFPFGYGLSYTTFTQEITSIEGSVAEDDEIKLTVKVTNTGSVAGKEVVQVYVTAPYIDGQIEKAYVTLVGFGKTKLLNAGESQSITVSIDPYSFASFDYADKNGNGDKRYELDAGAYQIKLMKNAHELIDSRTLMLASGRVLYADTVTNRYDDADDQLNVILSRTDFAGTWPQRRTTEEKTVDADFVNSLKSKESGNPLTADSDEVKNANLTVARKKSKEGIQLYDLVGKDFNDPLWEELLQRITMSSMIDLVNKAVFKSEAIDYISKPQTKESDSPAGWTNFILKSEYSDNCGYCSEIVLGSSWNIELAKALGNSIGNEAFFGYNGAPYTGWYAPGVNIHRSPFSGRNYEYFAEDPVLTGEMAAVEVAAARAKGVYAYVKHLAVNDQETNRNGVCTWVTEQAMREIYLKPFELAVKKGNAMGMMTSFNRLGTRWAGGDYRLLTEILRKEWGFKGAVITDFAEFEGYMNNKQMTYAGGDLLLTNLPQDKWVDNDNPVDVYVMKLATKNILYTVANSTAMNGLGEGAELVIKMPIWQLLLFIADGVVVVLLSAWGVFAIRGAFKRKEEPVEQ